MSTQKRQIDIKSKIENSIEKLVKIKKARKIIFVGDTHGDLEASQGVISEYLEPGNVIVFLGDYVDRSPFSRENLDFLLSKRKEFPGQICLLQGNHEAPHILGFSPDDFWQGLTRKEYEQYCSIVEKLPLAVITKDTIAIHGVLPDIENLEQINQIKLGDKEWFQIIWGDFIETPGGYLGVNPLTGRPEFGKDWFFKLMKRFDKKVLIRSHQPDAPPLMFGDRCLTIFTSSAYSRERTIAILHSQKSI